MTDTAPAGVSERVAAIARQVPGVVAVERVRVRPAGAVLFVELAVGVSRTLPLDRVAAITAQLIRAIRTDMPVAEVTITTEPRALDDETVRERVMVIARDMGLAIHHVAVQTISGRLSISADLEVEGTQPLAAAHEDGKPPRTGGARGSWAKVEVETHIEPLPADVLAGRDAAAAHIVEVRESCRRWPRKFPILPKYMTCACAKPPTAISSIFIAASMRRCRWPRCTTWWTRSSAGCAGAFRPSGASSATPNRGANASASRFHALATHA